MTKIVITGSNISRTDSETSSPVQVLTREDIAAMGASTVKDVLDKIPANTGALNDLGGSSSFAAGATGLSLRNLGKSATLILLNGRRVASYGLADGGRETFVNIDAIPLETIERVEILLDGASAIYGSDAVAGVINIITRKAYRGAYVKAAQRQSLMNSALDKDQILSLTWGRGDLAADGYNIFGHLEGFHRFPYSDRQIEPNVGQWYKDYVNPNFGVKSSYSNPGNYILRFGGQTVPVPVNGCPEVENGLCRFDQYARLGIHAEAKRLQFHGGARKQLGAKTELFTELTLSDLGTTYYNPPPIMQYTGTPSYWYSVKEGKLKSFTEPMLPVGHPYNPFPIPVELRYRYNDDPDVYKNATRSRQYRWMVGLEGQHGGWDWSTAAGVMGARSGFVTRGAKDAEQYLQAVLSGEYQFGKQNSAELLLRMFPRVEFGGESKQAFVDARASRELLALGGGPLALALGLDYRTDSFESWVGDNVANARVVGYGSINVDGARHMRAAYAELNAPFTRAFEVNAALRYDKVGSTEHSLMPKLGARYKFNDKLMLRATVSGGFRAPNAAETGKVILSAFRNGVVDPKRCATAQYMYQILRQGNDLDKADALRVRDSLGCGESFALAIQGNPDLAPEKSKSLNAGFVLVPLKNLSLTLDYYRLERRNEIGTQSVDQILAREDLLPGSVARNPVSDDDRRIAARVKQLSGQDVAFTVGTIGSLNQSYQNLNKTRVAGIDLDLDYKLNAGSLGRFQFGIKANYQLEYKIGNSGAASYNENYVGTYANYRYVLRSTASWKRGPWEWGAMLNYWPETSLMQDQYDLSYSQLGCAARGIPDGYCRLHKDMTLDLNTRYTGLAKGKILVNLDNALNRSPSADVRLADPVLRGRSLRVAYERDL
nr:TonB-dependent receptor [Massilia sp. TS11]